MRVLGEPVGVCVGTLSRPTAPGFEVRTTQLCQRVLMFHHFDGEEGVGDGLTDLVRIHNGEICYRPNLGYGRFGAKVTMDHAHHFYHPDQFDHKRIRLADIDGTGTTDIIYLHGDGVHLYFNGASQRMPTEGDQRPYNERLERLERLYANTL